MGIGTVIGWMMAMKVKMTAMPQMVSFFNGMGGACAAIISLVEYHSHPEGSAGYLLIVFLGLIIGSVSFSGSIVAYGKLDEKIKDISSKPLRISTCCCWLDIIGDLALAVVQPEMFGHSVSLDIVGFVPAIRHPVRDAHRRCGYARGHFACSTPSRVWRLPLAAFCTTTRSCSQAVSWLARRVRF
jgi:hypothetical protein